MTGKRLLEEAASQTSNKDLKDFLQDAEPEAQELAMFLWDEVNKKDPNIPAHIAMYRVGKALCEQLALGLLKAKFNRKGHR